MVLLNRAFCFKAFLILFISCETDYNVVFPEEVPLGTNLIYIDGELRTFQNNSYSRKTTDNKSRLLITFDENINNGEFYNRLGGITYWPQENTEYILTREKSEDEMTMQVSFSQVYDEDLFGWEYKFISSDDDYFLLEKYDTLNHIISGRGLLKFERKRKNGAPGGSGLDKVIICEFAFHDYFEMK